MNAKEQLAIIAKKIDARLEQILKEELECSGTISPTIKELIENMNGVCFSGKRLRGAFVYYSYIMCGGTDLDAIMDVACGIELCHSFLLVHDDIMDRSDLRHSKPTVHKIYEKIGEERFKLNKRDSMHFGESMGINVGDILSFIGYNLVLNAKFNSRAKVKALSYLTKQFADTGYGQVIDVFGGVLPLKKVDEDYVMLVHYFKTGKYTYEAPLKVGAILAGAPEDAMEKLSGYAVNGGIAFQIQDDILGMYGEAEKIGKPADSDLKEGKKTLLIVKALQNATRAQRKELLECLGNDECNKRMLNKARKIIRDTGSLDYSNQKALELVYKAQESLEKLNGVVKNPEGKKFLNSIAEYMIHRKY